MVWLLGHRLKSRYRTVTFFFMLGLMLAIGLLSYYCRLGFEGINSLFPMADLYSPCVLVLLLGTIFTARFCRKRCTLRRFLGWLPAWTGVVAFVVFLTYPAMLALAMFGSSVKGLLPSVMPVLTMGMILGGMVYLLNLPFLILAFKNPFYRQRFEALFGIEVVRRQDLERGDTSEPKEIG